MERLLNTDQLDLIEEFVKNLKSLRKDRVGGSD